MIRHVVLFKLKEGVTPSDSRVVDAVERFSHLGDEIPEVESWEVGWNITDRPVAYDFANTCVTADRAALQRYIEHPAHQAGVAAWSAFATWVIADYEF